MNKGIAAKEETIGEQTLERFSKAERFNKWMFSAIAKDCTGRLLEIGSGIGNLSVLLASQVDSIAVSDLDETYCNALAKRMSGCNNLEAVYRINLEADDFEEQYSSLLHKFDTVVALNVIEHIANDSMAIANCKKLLSETGLLVLLLPAHQCLFNSLDKALDHYRRYNKTSLNGLLVANGFEVRKMKYFNSPAIPGWWASGVFFKQKVVSKSLLSIYDKTVPLLKPIDFLTNKILGLSIIAVAAPQKNLTYVD